MFGRFDDRLDPLVNCFSSSNLELRFVCVVRLCGRRFLLEIMVRNLCRALQAAKLLENLDVRFCSKRRERKKQVHVHGFERREYATHTNLEKSHPKR